MAKKNQQTSQESRLTRSEMDRIVDMEFLGQLAYDIHKIVDKVQPEMWTRIRRLNSESYESSHEQLREAQSIGALAEAVEHLMKASQKIREAR